VAEEYRVVEKIRFGAVVEKTEWDDVNQVWVVHILDLKTWARSVRRAKILVSAVGALSVPKDCKIPGKEEYEGRMFHSAKWDHSFDWKGKDVVVLGI
jgi:cation diffusion facilitator CzcD-associated flavoprotein CzcO